MGNVSPIATIKSGAALMPIYPQSLDEVYRFAMMAFKCGTLPAVTRKFKTDDGEWVTETESDEAVLARGTMIIMQGMEVGLPPMQSLQLIALINGRTCIHSEGVPGLLLAKGCKIRRWFTGTGIEGEATSIPAGVPFADDWTHHTLITRPDGERHEGTFSIADAKRARLWDQRETVEKWVGKGDKKPFPNDSAWFKYWQRMLAARSLGFAAKDGAADIMRGLAVREEVEDYVRSRDAIDVTPREPYNAVAASKSSAPAFDPSDIPDEPANPEPASKTGSVVDTIAADVVDEPPSDAAIIRLIEREIDGGTDKAEVMAKYLARVTKMPKDEKEQALSLFGFVTT